MRLHHALAGSLRPPSGEVGHEGGGVEPRDTFEGGWGRILARLNHKRREIRMAHESDAAMERLEVLIGRWKTEGQTIDASGAPPDQIDAIDTYERLPGGALLHLVDAQVGDQKVEGAELIGHDPVRNTYATQSFGTDGLTAYEASLTEESEGLTWRMQSKTTRFTGRFSEDGNVITGHWELQGDSGEWQPWMDITLTRQA
jgi:hypothetical protein